MSAHGGPVGRFKMERAGWSRAALLCAAALVLSSCDWVAVGSAGSGGVQSNAASSEPDLSDDGRYLVFVSAATSLGPNSGGHPQVWRRDQMSGSTLLVSGTNGCAGSGCIGGSGTSRYPTVSRDGRYVVFSSTATDLVTGQATTQEQVYRADMQTGTHEPVSITPAGDTGNGRSTLFSIGTMGEQTLSDDGDIVVFRSSATDLGPGGSGSLDLFVHTVSTSATVLLSVRDDINSYELSDDGSRVVVGFFEEFISETSPEIVVYSAVDVYESDGSATIHVSDEVASPPPGGKAIVHAAIDGDGSHVLITVEDGDLPFSPVPYSYRLFDLSSGTAVQSALAYTNGSGIGLALDPGAEYATIRVVDGARSYRCPTAALQTCLDGAPTFPATDGFGTAVAHTFPAVSDNGRVFAWDSGSAIPIAGDLNGFADVYVSSIPVAINAVQLDGPLLPGGSVTGTITGTGFEPGDTYVRVGRLARWFTVTQVNVTSPTTLTAVFTASAAVPIGTHPIRLTVDNPAVSPSAVSVARCANCLIVG